MTVYKKKHVLKTFLTVSLALLIMLQSFAAFADVVWTEDEKGYKYTNEDGTFLKNKWKKADGNWYYMNSEGYRVTGWKKISGKWYYFDKEGVMQTGWLTLSGKTYYLGEDGVMVTGEVVIDGVSFTFDAGGALTESPEKEEDEEKEESKTPGVQYTVGSIVTLGSYEQDADTDNGKEAIEWMVLDENDEGYLLLSRYGLDVQRYNRKWAAVSWENCTIRTWLNDTFYNTAFSAEDKSLILTVKISDTKNSKYGTEAGPETSDNVFLLSIADANKYFTSNSARMCKPTAYADTKGAWHSQATSTMMNGWWFLRSPGGNKQHAAGVSTAGNVDIFGNHVNFDMASVRPAIWVRK